MAIEGSDTRRVVSVTEAPLPARPPRPANAEIKAMTGLRGIAAFLVAAYHFYPPHAIAGRALDHFVSKGYLWVDLFFVLSGFLMAMNYAHLFERGWSLRGWTTFLVRRFARIYPLYAFMIAATLLYTLAAFGSVHGDKPSPAIGFHNPAAAIAANVLMVQSWGFARSIDGVAWSLSTEWAAYLLFPFLAWLALFGTRRKAMLAGAAVAALVVGTAVLTAHDGAYHTGPLDAYDGRTLEPILRCLGGFVTGLLMYRLSRSDRVLAWTSRDLTIGIVVLTLVAGFATGAQDLAVYPLFALLVLGLYGNRGCMGRLFGCRPVYWLGVVSYSLYLLHSYLLEPRNWLNHALSGWLPPVMADDTANATACIVLLCLSGLAYRWIEEPGRKWMRRWAKATAPRAPAVERERRGERLAA